MKFFIFLIGTIALVFANEYPSKEEIEEVKKKFEEAVDITGATCDSHEGACKDLVNRDKHQRFLYEHQIKDVIEDCASLAKPYLCEQKQTGAEFAPLAASYLEMRARVKKTICENVYYANKEDISAGNVTSETIQTMLEDFNAREN